MKSLKQDIKQWTEKLSNALWFLGEHAFVVTLFFILGAGLIAASLFYQYVIFSPKVEEESIISEFKFQQELFEDILFKLEQEEAMVQQADFLNLKDLFNP